ncbi:MAG: hypothetical protein JW959_07685 [Pirellulales bacterium]|nr:hypothetical protein [Pirellulales bacterium]
MKRLHRMNDDELLNLSEAIDGELERRLELTDQIPDSARRRANSRQYSYRRATGSAAPPIRTVGLRDMRRPRAA